MIDVTVVKEGIFRENEVNADIIREELRKKHKLLVNVMSSPGSGKTSTLVEIIKRINGKKRVGVMECDIDATVDTETILAARAKAVQLHTGGMCHMDACMTKQGLDVLGIDDLDIIFIENIGNLVCPAEFDTGAHVNLTILSVPEGDDKPSKYPLIYEVSDVVLINKIDTLPIFDFDVDKCVERIKSLNDKAVTFALSAKTGEGMDAIVTYLLDKLNEIM